MQSIVNVLTRQHRRQLVGVVPSCSRWSGTYSEPEQEKPLSEASWWQASEGSGTGDERFDDLLAEMRGLSEPELQARQSKRRARLVRDIDLEELGLTREGIFQDVIENRERVAKMRNLNEKELEALFGKRPNTAADLDPQIVSAYVKQYSLWSKYQNQDHNFEQVTEEAYEVERKHAEEQGILPPTGAPTSPRPPQTYQKHNRTTLWDYVMPEGPRHSLITKALLQHRERLDPSRAGRKPVFQRFPGTRATYAKPTEDNAASLLHAYRLNAVKDYRKEWAAIQDRREKRRWRDLGKLDLTLKESVPAKRELEECLRTMKDCLDRSNNLLWSDKEALLLEAKILLSGITEKQLDEFKIGEKQADEESLEARRKRIQKERQARRKAEEEGVAVQELLPENTQQKSAETKKKGSRGPVEKKPKKPQPLF
eukprot:g27137.t1